MTPVEAPLAELLEDLRARGVEIALEGESLAVRAPRGAVTESDRQALAARREALIEFLRAERAGRAPETAGFALTDIQQAYWVGRRSIALGDIGCHAYREFVTERIDVPRLEAAWQRLVERHDMLRAVITEDGRNRVLDAPPPYRILVEDLRGRPDAAARLHELRESLSHRTFDPATWPLFDIRVTQCDDGTHLHVGMDLLIADAASMVLLYREWERLYADPGCALPPLARRFEDYVRAHRPTAEAQARAAAYWTARLPTLPGAPELPRAPAASASATPHFTRHARTLAPAVWAALRERARATGLTPNNVLAAAYADILAKWSRHPHFLVTLTTFQAPPEFAGVVGDFTSTLLLEVDARAPTFLARARALQARLAQDLDHAGWSGVRVLRELSRREGRLADAIPVVFTSALGHAGEAGAALPLAWLGRTVHAITQTPQVWIDHHVIEDGGSLVASWDVADGIFPAGLVETMFAAHGDFLHALAADDAAWAAPLGHHLPADQAARRRAVNATAAPLPPGFLHDGFFAWAAREPARTAVVTPQATLTYGELAAHARAVAHAVRAAGIGRDRLVGVSLDKGWEQVAAVLGIVAAGAAYLPIDPNLPPARKRHLATHGQLTLVFTAQAQPPSDWPEGVRAAAVGTLPPHATLPAPLEGADPSDLAYVLYTSGSTGQPKGVMIEHRAALNTIVDVNRRFGIGADDAVLGLSALSFDLSVHDLFGLLGTGGRLVLPDPARLRDPGHWLALLREHGVTVWNSVPALLTMLVDHGGAVGEALRVVLLSGDWIPLGLPARIKAVAPRCTVYGLGGATEAAIWSNWYEVRRIEPHWRSIPYGWPLANQSWHVLDDTGEPAPDGVAGRLHIAGCGLARGYWEDPARTAERFVLHPRTGERLYDTGDIGRYLPDGALEFLGREDAQVKVRGHRIELGEIEARLREHPAVAEALALAVGESAGERRLVAWIVPAGSAGAKARAPLAAANFSGTELLTGEAERLAWKLARHALRPAAPEAPRVALPAPAVAAPAWTRRTTRHFAPQPLALQELADFLAPLCARKDDDEGLGHRYRYPSAGAAYCVQAWLHVKEGRVETLAGGWYYHHPDRHDLERVSGEALDEAALHVAENRAAAQESAFSLFLVAALDAMEPLYGARARDFCLLEAGYMGQLLSEQAAAQGLGLCAIGVVDESCVAGALALGPRRALVHAFVAGRPAPRAQLAAPATVGEADLAQALARWCAESLPDYMVPAAFVTLDALPLTANGKVDRARLPDPAHTPAAPAPAPEGPLEQAVAAIFAEVLGRSPVGRDDAVFDLGGTSVHVVRIHRRLEERLARAVDIVDVFRYPTVRSLAAHLAGVTGPAAVADGTARARARRAASRGRDPGAGAS